eukprot:snap_masked-scaffold_2-processed-gene-25.11-mRNA-1 protein AED:1.00 eAED:1.00 QI:0/0/0/0/1/1/2/0/65
MEKKGLLKKEVKTEKKYIKKKYEEVNNYNGEHSPADVGYGHQSEFIQAETEKILTLESPLKTLSK